MFGLDLPQEAQAAAARPPPKSSHIVWEGMHVPTSKREQQTGAVGDVRAAIKRSLQQVPARLVVATGGHEDETRPWNSELVLKHLIDQCLQ